MAVIRKVKLPDGNTHDIGTTWDNVSGKPSGVTGQELPKVSLISNGTNNYPFHRFAYVTGVTSGYSGCDSVFLIRRYYHASGMYGIVKVNMTTSAADNKSAVAANITWLARSGLNADSVQLGRWGVSGNSCYADVFFKMPGTWMNFEIFCLSGSARKWTMVSSTEANSTTTSDRLTSTNCYSSISDAATQLHSGTAYTATLSGSDGGVVYQATRLLDSNNNSNTISVTYSKSGQSSTSWLASWNGYELGAISPANVKNVGSAKKVDNTLTLQVGGTTSKTFDGSSAQTFNVAANTTTVGSASGWSAGSAPTLGTAIAADDITAWDAGSAPTLGTAIAADDITSWSAGSTTTVSYASGVLTIKQGSAPALSYTARSIPNVTGVGKVPSLSYTARSIPNVTSVGKVPSLTVTNTTVATGIKAG